MKKFFLLIILFLIFSNSSIAYIKIGIDCASLVNQLGGLNKIDILWLENLNEKKYQYALINLSKKSNNRSYYLCGNKYNINASSDKTMNVLSERNLQLISKNPIDLFTEIFSLTSQRSRKYIMQRLNIDDFDITNKQLNQAFTAGLMKLNERISTPRKQKEKKIVKKESKKLVKKKEVQKNQAEITQKLSEDNTPPKILIANNLKFKNPSYKIEGMVEDEGSKIIYVEIDGIIQSAENGKFVFERFSPIDEIVKIVAIDQWGNRSKEKIVKIKIDTSSKKIVKKLEKLNPDNSKSNQINRNSVAVVIGIEKYERTPQASFANRDAKYFYEYARLSFGIPNENIKLLVDSDANLIQSLGVLNKWLPGKINKNETDLFIFFAGHGLASNDGEELYLLPQDSDPDLLKRTALSRTELFNSILDLEPRKVTMFFDTCYSGISRDDETLLASARPVRIATEEKGDIPKNFTIFTASKLNQISSGLKEANHGIFSYYLMKGLEGNADFNDDKKITNGELISYMDENVSQKASELGRKQNPSLIGDPNKVLISYR
jgi:hypothetical protein